VLKAGGGQHKQVYRLHADAILALVVADLDLI
jgi:hypothetical protein